MALPNCSSKSLESEERMRAAPWACHRFRLVAALRSRWLWRHLYRKVNAKCEMHTKGSWRYGRSANVGFENKRVRKISSSGTMCGNVVPHAWSPPNFPHSEEEGKVRP